MRNYGTMEKKGKMPIFGFGVNCPFKGDVVLRDSTLNCLSEVVIMSRSSQFPHSLITRPRLSLASYKVFATHAERSLICCNWRSMEYLFLKVLGFALATV